MRLYVYNKITKELIGSMDAYLDPLETQLRGTNIYSIPPYTTPIPPQGFQEGMVNVYNEETKCWSLVEDNRGMTVYNKKTGIPLVITELGEIPEDYTKEKVYSLQELKDKKREEINSKYLEAVKTLAKFNSISESVEQRDRLNKFISSLGAQSASFYENSVGEVVFVSAEDAEFAAKYLFIGSLLFPLKKKLFLDKVRKTRGTKELSKMKIDFNIKEELKQLRNFNSEQIIAYVKDRLEN